MEPRKGRAGGARSVVRALLFPLLLPLSIAGAGCLAGQWLTLDVRAHGGVYGWLSAGLLAIGLYGSARGISRPQTRGDVYRIVVAVTFGVVVKAAFIAAALWLVFRDRPQYLVLAVAMAQIDPLSVSAMLENRDMSERAKSLLAAWASFDDPVTTVLVVILGSMVLEDGSGVASGAGDYATTLLGNLVLLAVAAAVWTVLRDGPPTGRDGLRSRPAFRRLLPFLRYAALLALLVTAVWQFLMLGLALAALFFRPELGVWLGRATNAALVVATFLLGMLLAGGADLAVGAVLGVATFLAQTLVAAVVGLGFSRRDRASLCLSQQNGITAIILALLLEPRLPEAVAIIAPAILVVNVLHLSSTGLLARARRGGPPGPAEDGGPRPAPVAGTSLARSAGTGGASPDGRG
ncbi:hypothetical protein GCM10010503_20940 [Streptomyces lucensis JCM 4490]|uniref:Uncharacterized protein n=1 Tax=Streptomyces lucensis JCM 4490 TaxID=1306176 RepID=A0A918J2G7_9ACTN|nr:hypothetical protein [Streptomyces lucensis]GGW44047.1 hypothetical protein GCM10010503_20940 [Streptomyces lucensis JCM 4490]